MTDNELKKLVASLAVSQKETDMQIKEMSKDLSVSQKETDKQIKELGKQIGGLGNRIGSYTVNNGVRVIYLERKKGCVAEQNNDNRHP